MPLILIPAVITLAVTLLRLVGELQHWSPALFNPAAGGGGSLVGISWLIPIFGIYFAWALNARGEGPSSAWKAAGLALLAALGNTAVMVGVFAMKVSPLATLAVFAVTSWIAIVVAYRGWPALGRTLLTYAAAARLPVAILMLVAIFGNWGTHYDVAPPDVPQVDAMTPIVKWFWIGLVPQATIWIYLTVVGGMIVGGVTAAIAGRRGASA
jgi:hypothetical protein